MARGDYVEIIYRTGSGIERHRVQARSIGGTVEVSLPSRPNDVFVEVSEVKRGGDTAQSARFNKADVIGLVEGHVEFSSRKKAKP